MILFEKLADKINPEKTIEVTTNRQDAMRGRIRTKLSDGEDLIINLPRGQPIGQGDIFGPSEKGNYYKILIEMKETYNKGHFLKIFDAFEAVLDSSFLDDLEL